MLSALLKIVFATAPEWRHANTMPKPLHSGISCAWRRSDAGVQSASRILGADETAALQGGQARNAFLAVADGTAAKDEALLARVVSTAFSQRRKMLRNTLRGLADVAMLDAVGIVPTARAEELGVEDFVRLTDALAERAHG